VLGAAQVRKAAPNVQNSPRSIRHPSTNSFTRSTTCELGEELAIWAHRCRRRCHAIVLQANGASPKQGPSRLSLRNHAWCVNARLAMLATSSLRNRAPLASKSATSSRCHCSVPHAGKPDVPIGIKISTRITRRSCDRTRAAIPAEGGQSPLNWPPLAAKSAISFKSSSRAAIPGRGLMPATRNISFHRYTQS
jgi:hypothetical protein